MLAAACGSATEPSGTTAAPPAPSTDRAGTASRGDEARPAAEAPVSAVPLKKIRVAMTGLGVSYLPHRIAQVEGFNRDAGFDVELVNAAGNALISGLVAGEFDFIDSGGASVRAAAAGLPVRLVACHGIGIQNWMLLAPGVPTLRDLEDKAVGVASIGGVNELIARDLIRKAGGDPSRVSFAALGAADVRYGALLTGRVGGAIVAAAEVVQGRNANMTVAATPADLPHACTFTIAVAQQAIAERPQDVRGYVRAISRAVGFLQGERERSARILAEWQGIDEQVALAAYDESLVQLTYSFDKAAGEDAVRNAIAMERASGGITADIDVKDIFDLSFYP
jgi:NitT/TauT family transport system substrate-binding protein